MPHVRWSKSFPGELPGLLLGADRVLVHRTGPGAALRAFDLDGREVWTRPGLQGHRTLGPDRFLVTDAEGTLLVLDGRGAVVHRWSGGKVETVGQHGDLLVLVGGRKVWGADLDLTPLWRLDWPGDDGPHVECLAGGAFYWVAGWELRFCDLAGRTGTLAPVPDALVAETREEYEKESGDTSGQGLPIFWRLAADLPGRRFFLANSLSPHLVLCLDAAGGPLWCRGLSGGCCGGTPARLPDGRLVASSGCGGVLSWLAADGRVLFQSRPHPGTGLASAFGNDVRVLPDGRVLADGLPGVVAYSASGNRLWQHERFYSEYVYEPAGGYLVGCYWYRGDAERGQATVELVEGV